MNDIISVNPNGPRIVIISAERVDKDVRQNAYAHAELSDVLRNLGIRHAEAQGCYKAHKELSYVCIAADDITLNNLRKLAKYFDQECILVANEYRDTYLDDVADGSRHDLNGRLCEVTKVYAEKQEAYTILNDKYYTVVQ